MDGKRRLVELNNWTKDPQGGQIPEPGIQSGCFFSACGPSVSLMLALGHLLSPHKETPRIGHDMSLKFSTKGGQLGGQDSKGANMGATTGV